MLDFKLETKIIKRLSDIKSFSHFCDPYIVEISKNVDRVNLLNMQLIAAE